MLVQTDQQPTTRSDKPRAGCMVRPPVGPHDSVPLVLLGYEIEKLNERLNEAFACIRTLNEENRIRCDEITALRGLVGNLKHEVGMEFEGFRVIPRAAAAKLLHRHPRTLKRWEKAKQLHPRYPFPNQVYYRVEEVEAVLGLALPSRPIQEVRER